MEELIFKFGLVVIGVSVTLALVLAALGVLAVVRRFTQQAFTLTDYLLHRKKVERLVAEGKDLRRYVNSVEDTVEELFQENAQVRAALKGVLGMSINCQQHEFCPHCIALVELGEEEEQPEKQAKGCGFCGGTGIDERLSNVMDGLTYLCKHCGGAVVVGEIQECTTCEGTGEGKLRITASGDITGRCEKCNGSGTVYE